MANRLNDRIRNIVCVIAVVLSTAASATGDLDPYRNEDWLYSAAALAEAAGKPIPDIEDLMTTAPLDALLPLPGRITVMPSGITIRWTRGLDGWQAISEGKIRSRAHVPTVVNPSSIWLFGIGGLCLIIGVPLARIMLRRNQKATNKRKPT